MYCNNSSRIIALFTIDCCVIRTTIHWFFVMFGDRVIIKTGVELLICLSLYVANSDDIKRYIGHFLFNPNLQIVITHVSHVCSQHHLSRTFRISTLVIWSRVFWSSVSKSVSTWLSSVLPNLWLLLVTNHNSALIFVELTRVGFTWGSRKKT